MPPFKRPAADDPLIVEQITTSPFATSRTLSIAAVPDRC